MFSLKEILTNAEIICRSKGFFLALQRDSNDSCQERGAENNNLWEFSVPNYTASDKRAFKIWQQSTTDTNLPYPVWSGAVKSS